MKKSRTNPKPAKPPAQEGVAAADIIDPNFDDVIPEKLIEHDGAADL